MDYRGVTVERFFLEPANVDGYHWQDSLGNFHWNDDLSKLFSNIDRYLGSTLPVTVLSTTLSFCED